MGHLLLATEFFTGFFLALKIGSNLHIPVLILGQEDLGDDEGDDGRRSGDELNVSVNTHRSLRLTENGTLTNAGPQSHPKPFCALRINARCVSLNGAQQV